MRTSPEIITLLKQLDKGEVNRDALARWLAVKSLRFLQSGNESDRRVIADLDVALSDVRRGVQSEDFLAEVAKELLAILQRGASRRTRIA